ncbi:MAG: FAD-dependent oxidoreductase [Pseudomonadota bacterium]
MRRSWSQMSLWERITPEKPGFGSLSGSATADVVVVGGGFLGLSTALRLAQSGTSVLLLEGMAVGFGASGRNTGFVVPSLRMGASPEKMARTYGAARADAFFDLVDRSGDTTFGFIEAHGMVCGAEQSGWFQPAHSKTMRDALAKRADASAARGRPVRMLGAEAAAAITGLPLPFGALFDESGGQLNPLAYVRALASAAVAHGVRIFECSPAIKLSRNARGWVVQTPSGEAHADRVLLCTNALSGRLHPPFAASLAPLRVFQIATEPLPEGSIILAGRQSLSDTRRHTFALRRGPDNSLVTGGLVPLGPRMAERAAAKFHARLVTMTGQQAIPRVAHVWSGKVALTVDGLPRFSSLAPGLDGVVCCNGRGVALTTALSAEIAAHLLGKDAPALPRAPHARHPARPTAHFGPSLWLPWQELRDRLDAGRVRHHPSRNEGVLSG